MLFLAVCCARASAFIPSVPQILREVFDGRRGRKATEVHLRHRVQSDAGAVEIDERIFVEKGKPVFLFKAQGSEEVFGAALQKGQYAFRGGLTVPTSSIVVLKYLLATTSEELQGALVAEQFVRREQLQQFKGGFTAEGDPALWDLKTVYLIHPGIYLARFDGAITIAVSGLSEADESRAVYFDRSLKGIRRVEWRSRGAARAWRMEGFVPMGSEGRFPSRLSFLSGESTLVFSELKSLRVPSESAVRDLRAAAGRGGGTPSGAVESALRTLLGYR